ncbi:MAG: hypothetical protein K2O18_14995 [Oscillospiraceae bacterium]|nr:hypothetical protein [Oscillospiraceae bacterium]
MRYSKTYFVRIFAVIAGIFMVGIAVGLFKLAEMGADPFTAMNTGICTALGLQFGTLQLLVNMGILLLIFFVKREFIGFGTIFNMIFVGYTADLVMWLTAKTEIPFHTFPVRIAALAAAALLICIGDALYISADMGMSPYDAAGYVAEVLTGEKVPFRFARIILDILCVCTAYFTGVQTEIQWKIIGIGTVLLTFCTGPLIQFFRIHWSDPLLTKTIERVKI